MSNHKCLKDNKYQKSNSVQKTTKFNYKILKPKDILKTYHIKNDKIDIHI